MTDTTGYAYAGLARTPDPGTQEIVIEIPPTEWLTSNMRPHYQTRARKTKALRNRGGLLARTQLAPATGPVIIACETYYRGNKPPDVDAAAPTLKAILDGFTDARIWPDDSPRHVGGIYYQAPTRHPELHQGWHALRITITNQHNPI